MDNNEFKCRHTSCNNQVKDENIVCEECKQEEAEFFLEMERDLKIQQFAEGL